MVKARKGKGHKRGMNDVVSVEATINLHKLMHGRTFKHRAPTAVKKVKKFGERMMGTSDVRVDVKLNKYLWQQGIKGVPRRVRIRLDRKRNEDEDAKEKLYTVVSWVPCENFNTLE
eukprot:453612_1